ncbi:MAG: GTP 3',8-cyclase MoaA [Myxococcota bacterium]
MRENFQPLSPLRDGFGRIHSYLRISITERCDLRCQYCMPPEGIQLQPRAHLLTLEEIERLASLLVRLGVNKIRLTGGEPMVRRGVEQLVERLGQLQVLESLGMTSNGILLSERLPQLIKAGLTHLNLSLDTWHPERFAQITLRDQFLAVQHCLSQALEAPLTSLKLNCVVMAGVNDDELFDFVAFTQDHALEVRFIEYMPFSGNGWDTSKLFTYAQMRARIAERFELVPVHTPRANETASVFQVPGFKGRVGFITSMTDHFCATCNRLRLTADGNIKNCLFDNGELSLRDPMRAGADDAELEKLIRLSIARKHARHGGHSSPEAIALDPGRSMIQIGG